MAKAAAEEKGTGEKAKETGGARVYLTLRTEILTMKLQPGTALDEGGLAERFDMSRSPIREALARLSAEGLVTTLANRTTMVTPLDFARVPEFLDALDLLQRVTTRLAATHRTMADLSAIREAQKAYERDTIASLKTNDSLPMIESNYEFHMAVARAGHNSYFAELYRRLLEEGRRMLHLHFEYKTRESGDNVAAWSAITRTSFARSKCAMLTAPSTTHISMQSSSRVASWTSWTVT
jgi:DNA-binding GntR family transcriptional regulator